MRRTLLVLALTLAIVAPGGAQQAPCAPREGQHSGMMGMQNMMEMGMMARVAEVVLVKQRPALAALKSATPEE